MSTQSRIPRKKQRHTGTIKVSENLENFKGEAFESNNFNDVNEFILNQIKKENKKLKLNKNKIEA